MKPIKSYLTSFVLPIILALIAAMPGYCAWKGVNELHVLINSRMTELLQSSKESARQSGKAEGIESERQRKGKDGDTHNYSGR